MGYGRNRKRGRGRSRRGPVYFESTNVVIPWWKLLWRRLMGGGGGLGFGGPFDVPDMGMQGIASRHAQANGISGMLGGIQSGLQQAAQLNQGLDAAYHAYYQQAGYSSGPGQEVRLRKYTAP